jgi:hypothetical protein
LVEQRTENPRVAGSIPALGTFLSLPFIYHCRLPPPFTTANSNLHAALSNFCSLSPEHPFSLHSAVKEDENGAADQKHNVF